VTVSRHTAPRKPGAFHAYLYLGRFYGHDNAMKQLPVRFHILSTLYAWLDVIDLQPIVCPKVQSTIHTSSICGLFFARP